MTPNLDAEFGRRMLRIAMLTSGGGAPGMNEAIRAATVVALEHEPADVRHGYRGLIDGKFLLLDALLQVGGAWRSGETILQPARRLESYEPAGCQKRPERCSPAAEIDV
jgi:6-phosphofructokinase 1|tara:strand:- start:3127 stop:3453 length:327 start_codon:yes stop_codon:yes gene_type:complete